MVKEELAYTAALSKVRKACRIAYLVIRVLFIMGLIVWMLLLVTCILLLVFPGFLGLVGSVDVPTVVQIIVSGLMVILMLWFVLLVLKDMYKGGSPFTLVQSKRIRAIAYVLFARVVVGAFLSSGLLPLFAKENVFVGFQSTDPTQPTLFVDVGTLIIAVVFYCVSLVFEYGTLLQREKDTFI